MNVFLVLTSAVAIAGEIFRAGSLVEVSEADAVGLLHRGKARVATAEDGAPEPEPEPAAEQAKDENATAKAAGKSKDKPE